MDASPAQRFLRDRTSHHSRFDAATVAAARAARISACVPARECAATVGAVVQALAGLRRQGVLDDIVVVDAASRDGTAQIARGAGATVHQEAELMPQLGPVLGKGDAMYRALSVIDGDIVVFLDADTVGPTAQFALGLLGPLVCEPDVSFCKAFYRRPYHHDGISIPDAGGRVNHLLARPALALFYPELAGIRQPLAGETAATRDLLDRLPFATGYGVEVGLLIDAWRAVGLQGMAQVEMDEQRNAHQSLQALSRMSYAVLAAIAARMQGDGILGALDPSPLLGPEGPELVYLVERPARHALASAR